MRDLRGRFIKGAKPENNGRGTFKKGHPGYLNHPNKTSFKKGNIPWTKGKKGIHLSIKTEFKKGQKSPAKGKFGEESTNWRGGRTSLARQIRLCFKYRQWRSDIFTRDSFTCVLCGKIGGCLEADHYPKRFSDIFYESKVKTIQEALEYEEFWNINNGRTLCQKCHKKTETYGGISKKNK